MKLIVGLGNPWKKYEKTRHNIWFVVLERFIQQNALGEFSYDNKHKWETLQTTIDGEKVIFLKPMEFMNLSWNSLRQITNFYKIGPKDILIIHDDIDLPTAKIQIKLWGSAAGHNGLKDIINKLGTKDFWRLRIGIDRPTIKEQVSEYVLSSFTPEEKEKIADQQSTIEKHIYNFIKK